MTFVIAMSATAAVGSNGNPWAPKIFFKMEDLRDQFDGVRGFDTLSCGFHMFEFQSSNKNALRSSCEMVCIFCDGLQGAAVPNPPRRR
jgi:hypothetical protein